MNNKNIMNIFFFFQKIVDNIFSAGFHLYNIESDRWECALNKYFN